MKRTGWGSINPGTLGLEPTEGNYIGNLNPQWPDNPESIAEGDDHLRACKRAFNNTFPNLGINPVALTEAQINNMYNMDIGTISMFSGFSADIPAGWEIVEGLVGYYPRTSSSMDGVGGKKDGNNTKIITIAPFELEDIHMPSHTHQYSTLPNNGTDTDEGSGGLLDRGTYGTKTFPSVGGGDAHTHTIATVSNEPLYHSLVPIRKIGGI
jgi:hypothetical protein